MEPMQMPESPDRSSIADVGVATVRAYLDPPIQIGDRVLTYREYAVVRMTSTGGSEGWAYGLTRGGAVAETIKTLLADSYVGSKITSRESTFWEALRSSPAVLSSGIGLRALSLLDLAAWDVASKLAGLPIAEFLGGRNQRLPATAIVGYPPDSTGPAECADEVRMLGDVGFARFKCPIAASRVTSASRIRAIRSAAPAAWLALDGAWTFRSADDAVEFLESIEDVDLGWFEDVFLPGDLASLVQLRRRSTVRIAMGDDQGESYFPAALITANAVDVVRFDLTCMGGITRGRLVIQQAVDAGIEVSPHIFSHVHGQVLAGLGHTDVACEWALPGKGVDPYAESLSSPAIAHDGFSEAFPNKPGFGSLVNLAWARDQDLNDPQGILQL